MATSKTGSFYLTETVTLPATSADGTVVQESIDIGAYVNVPTGQAIAIESVDFVYQNAANRLGSAANMLASQGAIHAQLSDLNPGTTMLLANDHSLVASGSINVDQANNIASQITDLYPDNFGPSALSEAFMVVNDTLYLTAGVGNSAISGANVFVTARIRCRVVKLSSKDWMAIAIQSTAADN
tara:strand:+ start:719 stop:1270 length:552 start_codon:yes stop_codon:yes gene_type:complete